MGLIDSLDGRTIDVRNSEARLRLRGSVRMMLPVLTADDMEAWLRRYRVKSIEPETEPNLKDKAEAEDGEIKAEG